MAQARTATVDLSFVPDLTGSDEESSDKGLTSCFIATAVYGSYLDAHVQTLRNFRDDVLLESRWGRSFVQWYYANSPPIASAIADSEVLKVLVKLLLAPLILIISYPLLALLSLFTLLSIRLYYQKKKVLSCES